MPAKSLTALLRGVCAWPSARRSMIPTFADFETDLIKMRTREGMKIARAKGKLRGKKPKLSEKQHRELRRMYDTRSYSISDLADIFTVSRLTIYRTLKRTENTN